jgi:hypothetical protein
MTAREALQAASHALRSYQYGNASPDLAAEIADACDAALGMMGWRGMESAPRDGTPVLVFSPGGPEPHINVAHWAIDAACGDWWWLDAAPTHWMPLPEPPK